MLVIFSFAFELKNTETRGKKTYIDVHAKMEETRIALMLPVVNILKYRKYNCISVEYELDNVFRFAQNKVQMGAPNRKYNQSLSKLRKLTPYSYCLFF